jgi:hypothetical protein
MNYNRQRNRVRQIALAVIKNLGLTVITIFAVTAAGELAFQIALPFRGTGNADAGVPIYSHIKRALALWLLTFPIFSFLFVFIIQRTLCKNNYLPYWVGTFVSIHCSYAYLFALSW